MTEKFVGESREENLEQEPEKKETKIGWREKVWQIDITPRGESGESDKRKMIFDSKTELEPLQYTMHRESDGDIMFDFSSNDKGDENQRFELIINGETYTIVTLKPSPEGEAFAELNISRDELSEAVNKTNKSELVFRLRRCE